MLPRPQRLRSNQQFQRVYRSGRSWAHPLVVLHVLPRLSGKRVGVSVSKKVGKAAVRNRVRRRVREILRELLPAWKEGFEAVVVTRPAAADAAYGHLGEAIGTLGRRARLAREPDEALDTLYTVSGGGRPPREEGRARGRGRSERPAKAASDGSA
jgi:ribonuclease P protein component